MASRIFQCSFFIIFLLLALPAVSEEDESASHFGHGVYRCIYQDKQTGKHFIGESGGQETAMKRAQKSCIATLPRSSPKTRCAFYHCTFR